MSYFNPSTTPPVTMARQLAACLEGRTVVELAYEKHLPVSLVLARLTLLELHPDVAALVDRGDIPAANGYVLAGMTHEAQLARADAARKLRPHVLAGVR